MSVAVGARRSETARPSGSKRVRMSASITGAPYPSVATPPGRQRFRTDSGRVPPGSPKRDGLTVRIERFSGWPSGSPKRDGLTVGSSGFPVVGRLTEARRPGRRLDRFPGSRLPSPSAPERLRAGRRPRAARTGDPLRGSVARVLDGQGEMPCAHRVSRASPTRSRGPAEPSRCWGKGRQAGGPRVAWVASVASKPPRRELDAAKRTAMSGVAGRGVGDAVADEW